MVIKTVGVYGGLGKMGGFHAKRLRDEHPEIDVHIFDLVGATTSHECDAYIIATPSETHYQIAKELLEKGKHVLVEKPLTLNFFQALVLQIAAEENNATLLVSHTQRYNSAFLSQQKKLSEANVLKFIMHLPHDNETKNLVFDLMIHSFEAAMFLTGEMKPTDPEIIFTPEETRIRCEVMLGETLCIFDAAYHSPKDIRIIESDTTTCDLKKEIEGQPDSLALLHNRFLELCETGTTPEDIQYAIAAVALAEGIQERLFT